MIDYYNDIFPVFQGMMLVYIGLRNYFILDKAYRFYFFHILCWLLYFTIRSQIFYDWINIYSAIRIEDIVDMKGKALGTCVRLTLPI